MIDEKEHHFNNVSLVLRGSGITPGYQLIARILRAKDEGEVVRGQGQDQGHRCE